MQTIVGTPQAALIPTFSGSIGTLPWFALKVRARGEAQIGEALQRKNYETFVPSYIESRQYSDRIKKVQTALFPGYVFCRFDPSRRLPVLTTPGVEYVLGNGRELTPVSEAEIDSLRTVLQAGNAPQPYPFLEVGQKVRVECGSFSGVEGQVVRQKSGDLLVLSVTLLQRSVSIEIDRTWLRPVS